MVPPCGPQETAVVVGHEVSADRGLAPRMVRLVQAPTSGLLPYAADSEWGGDGANPLQDKAKC